MPEPEPEPEPEPVPGLHTFLLLCAPDGRRPLAAWGPTLYSSFVLPEALALACCAAALGSDACVRDALRAVSRHAQRFVDDTAAHVGDAELGRCSGKPQPAAPPLALRLPAVVAAAVAQRQTLGDLLAVRAEADGVDELLAALRDTAVAVAADVGVYPVDGRVCIVVQVWGGSKMSSKAKHRLADRCAEAAGLADAPRVGADEAAPTDTLFVCAGVRGCAQQQPERWYFARRSTAAAQFLHGLRRFDVSHRPLLGDAPTRPPLALAMANLAQIQPGELVLDPFVGSGALLLAAAELGARTLGVDNDPALLLGTGSKGSGDSAASVFSNFQQLGLPRPDLICGDSLTQGCGVLSARGAVDVIVSDPPFGLRYPCWRMFPQLCPPPSDVEGWAALKTKGFDHAAVNHAVCVHVLTLAAELLADGGRLVFLMPGKKGGRDVKELLAVAMAAAGPEVAGCLRPGLGDEDGTSIPIPSQEFQNILRHCLVMHCVRVRTATG